jgi:parallel beta-helix repeat protein
MKIRFEIPILFTFIFVMCVFGFSAEFPAEAQPLFNEVMASNSSSIMDEDGEFPDWIEIYNPGDTSIDLTGFGLSDSPDNPYKWIFPNYLILPKQHLLVFASGKDKITKPSHWETVIDRGDEWRYIVGTSEPPDSWHSVGFDDSGWESGPTSIGSKSNDATIIPKSISFYLRKTFEIDAIEDITHCLLQIDYQDGFVAYINGHEIARSNVEGTPPSYDQKAITVAAGGTPKVFEMENIKSILHSGENVLAVQVHKKILSLSTSVIPYMTLGMFHPPENPTGVPGYLDFSIRNFNLHSNFKISSDGEPLVLTDPDGALSDSVYANIGETDISFGRMSDGNEKWVLFFDSTPGESNTTEGYQGVTDTLVEMSLPGGFYDGSIAVELTTASPMSEIRYTLDSTEPIASSPLYSYGLTVSSTTVIRARAFEPGKLPGEINTATYIVNDDHPETDVAEYFITCKSEDFDYLYANYEENTYVPVTITYKGKLWSQVGMRIRGDDSRQLPKKSLKLKFSGEPFQFGSDMLNFNAEYYDRSYISQYLTSRLMRESGHPVFKSEHARVYLNGKYLGLYLRIENIDEYFLEANNLDPEGNLYKATVDRACLGVYDIPDSVWEKKTNADEGITDLLDLIDRINTVPDKDYFAFANEHLDYEKMVNMVSLHILFAHGSTYYHNYFMYHDIHGTGKWMMFPWDMDKTFGQNYTYHYPYQRSSPSFYPDNPFHERAVLNETILNDIRARINEFSETIFDKDYLYGIIDSLHTVLESSVREDITDAINDIGTWNAELDDRREYAEKRIDNLNNQFENFPRPFRVEPTPEIVTETPTLVWHPSRDPNGDPITYIVKYSHNSDLYTDITVVKGIADTTYTFPNELEPGTYYWKIVAEDGNKIFTRDYNSWDDESFLCEGFNSVNVFTIVEKSIIPASIDGDVVLTQASSPYYVNENATVKPGGSLTVEPGVEIILSEAVNVYVHGTISMNGSFGDPIIVQSSSESTRWGAICIENAPGISTFSHVVISDASSGPDYWRYRAAVSGESSRLVLENVRFENNLDCIATESGSLSVRNCVFAESNKLQHVHVDGGTAIVENSEFHSNFEGDSIDMNGVIDGSVSNNLFVSIKDDGIDIGSRSVNMTITGNRIYGCADKGISIGENSYGIDISRNIITDSLIGIAVKDSSTAVIDHNTLYNNDTSISLYSKDTPYGGDVIVTNSIISQSVTAALSADEKSTITVSYSLSDGEQLPGTGNLFASPDFYSPGNNDFRLKSSSLAIDSGNPENNPDIDGSRNDMGAVPYMDSELSIVINEINYNSSNDFNTGDWIEIYNSGECSVELTGWVIKDGNDNNTFEFPENTNIGSDEYLVICRNDLLFGKFYPEIKNHIGDLGFGFDSGSELIRLLNSGNVIVDSLTYFDSSPWPVEPDGGGSTLALKNPLESNNRPENWAASAGHGSPGEVNDMFSGIHETTESETLTAFVLGQNYPNPFNPMTTIPFKLPKSCRVMIHIYSITGQRIANVLDVTLPAGNHQAVFNADHLPSGMYFYRIESDGFRETKSMLFLK